MSLISPLELNKIKEKVKILDVRWSLSDKGYLNREYCKSHIPKSIMLDIEQFSNKESPLPHMMPKKPIFESLISNLGIENNDDLVLYDQTGFISSSRIWFMFKNFGHKKISILNGGFKNWIKNNLPCDRNFVKLNKTNYIAKEAKNHVVNKKFVKSVVDEKNYLIIDARPNERFSSKKDEPRPYVKRGNIPNSINIPFTEIHDKNGLVHEKKKLESIFFNSHNIKNKEVICTCGSGVTACNIIFALYLLKKKNVYLYDGSWSEWGKN